MLTLRPPSNRLYMMLKGFKSKVFGASRPQEPEVPAPPETPPAPAKLFRRLEDRVAPDDSVISAQSTFRGEIGGRAGVRVAGEMRGDIRSEGLVCLEETARMKGNIYSSYVILGGELEGDIGPSLHVELRSRSRMQGNIQTKLLAIADGSHFEGKINMSAPDARHERFAEKRQPK
jgi:cytoskeletal protein CcmA (bactofilin family)